MKGRDFKNLTKIEILFFLVLIVASFLTQSIIVLFVGALLLIIFDKRFIVSFLLITPIFENLFIVTKNLSITKMIVIFIILLFGFKLISLRRLKINKYVTLIFIFLILLVWGLANACNNDIISLKLQNSNLFLENFLNYFPKILFAFLLFEFFSVNDDLQKLLFQNLTFSLLLIPLFLLLVTIYFVFFQRETVGFSVVYFTLPKTPHGEFTAILASLTPYCWYLILLERNKSKLILGVISLISVFVVIMMAASRNGFLSFILGCTLSLYFLKNFLQKKGKYVLVIFAISIIILLILNFIDLSKIPLYQRFSGKYTYTLEILTSKRNLYWGAALKAFTIRPLTGYGGYMQISSAVNSIYTGEYDVFHNTFLDILVQYGVIGFLVYVFLLFNIFKDFYRIVNNKQRKLMPHSVILIPFLSFFVLIFASMGLSWLWREIVWYHIGICIAISINMKDTTLLSMWRETKIS